MQQIGRSLMFFLYVNEGKLGGGQFILTTTEQGKRKLSMWKKKGIEGKSLQRWS